LKRRTGDLHGKTVGAEKGFKGEDLKEKEFKSEKACLRLKKREV
jgi:hypothetical protein